jgi:1-acyl-sn-glycerol-3-phosphate acyltransferase
MASTSEVATAPASPGAATRPARTLAVAHGWRVLRAGVAFFSFGVGAIVVAGIVWPLRLLPERTSARREVAVQRVVRAAFRLFAWWMRRLGLIRVSWIGAEGLRGSAPRLVVANHPTLIDVVLLLAQLPQADCVVKTAARRNPFMRSIVTAAGYLANDHGDALVDACAERIARGRSVVLFPEGTRSPRGGLRRFQRGAAHIALKSGCPIVPVVITCRPPILLKGQPWHDVADRRACFVLRVGEPIDPAQYLDAETTVPVAARRLTADLQTLYDRQLSADEGHA